MVFILELITSYLTKFSKNKNLRYMKNNYSDNFFEVGSKFGFLPKNHPLIKLPERYLGFSFIWLLGNILDVSKTKNGYVALYAGVY